MRKARNEEGQRERRGERGEPHGDLHQSGGVSPSPFRPSFGEAAVGHAAQWKVVELLVEVFGEQGGVLVAVGGTRLEAMLNDVGQSNTNLRVNLVDSWQSWRGGVAGGGGHRPAEEGSQQATECVDVGAAVDRAGDGAAVGEGADGGVLFGRGPAGGASQPRGGSPPGWTGRPARWKSRSIG